MSNNQRVKKNAQATIDILGPTNERITTIQTNSKLIKSKEIGELTAEWIPKDPGFYSALATLRYDGKTSQTQKTFYIGNVEIELLEVQVKNFRLGGVAKFDLTIENKWNDLVKNVFIEITMKTKEGNILDTFKSTSSDIASLAKETIVAYWDTTNINPGQYDATITMHYADNKKTERQFTADVSLDNIRLSSIGATAQVISSTGLPDNSLIAFLVVILIAINIGWFIYFKKKK